MKLNKVLCLFLMLTLVFAFVGCKKDTGTNDGNNNNNVTPTMYTVEFDSAGGSAVESQSVEENKLATEPAAPTKEGYTFLGWFLGETQWNFAENKVTASITLIAHWEEVEPEEPPVVEPTKYTVTYMDGENVLALTPNEFTSESTGLVLPEAPAKAHYDFAGWYSDAALTNKVESIDVTTEDNIVLYASYVAKTYKVTYMLDGGVNAEANPATYTVEDIPTIVDPSKDEHNFLGWFTDANCTVAFEGLTAENAGNVTLYAKWEKIVITYTITYLDHNYNPIAGLEPSTYQTSDSDIMLPTYELDGYTFLGWTNRVGQPVDCIPAGMEGDVYLFANLKVDVTSYKLTYVLDGTVWQEKNVDNSADFSEYLVPNVAGYTFSGWTLLDGSVAGTIPAGNENDVTVYGTLTAITYTITYVVDGATVTLEPATYVVSDTATNLPEVPAKAGHNVLGWYDADGNKVTAIEAGKTGDLVLTAQYEEIVYSITYNLNGGENDERNESEYKPGNVPTLYDPMNRDGYLFQGWYTTSTYVGAAVTDLAELPEGDITLWAKWVPVNNGDSNSTLTPEVPF